MPHTPISVIAQGLVLVRVGGRRAAIATPVDQPVKESQDGGAHHLAFAHHPVGQAGLMF